MQHLDSIPPLSAIFTIDYYFEQIQQVYYVDDKEIRVTFDFTIEGPDPLTNQIYYYMSAPT